MFRRSLSVVEPGEAPLAVTRAIFAVAGPNPTSRPHVPSDVPTDVAADVAVDVATDIPTTVAEQR